MGVRQLTRHLAQAILIAGLVQPIGVAYAQTLTEAMALAYENNPALQAVRAGQRATDELLPQAKALFWRPQVTISGNAGVTQINQDISRSNAPTTDTSELTNDQQVGLSAQLFLYRGGQTVAGIRNAEAQIDEGKYDLDTFEQELLQEVVEAYAGVLLFQAQIKFFGQEVDSLMELETETKDMFKSRLVTITGVSLVETYVSQAQVEAATAQSGLGENTAQFFGVVGQRPVKLESWPNLPMTVPETLDDAVKVAFKQSPVIKAGEASVRASEATVEQLKGVLLPNVSLYGSVSREWNKSRYSGDGSSRFDEFDTEDTLSGGVQVTMPLYQGGSNYSFIRQAKELLSESILNLANDRVTVEAAVIEYWEELGAAIVALADAQAGVKAANVAVEGALREYRKGTLPVQDLLTTRDQRIDSLLDYANSEYEKLVATANLFAAMGLLNAEQIGLPVKIYDPDEYKREVEDKLIGYDTK